jgi:hypothetical protein
VAPWVATGLQRAECANGAVTLIRRSEPSRLLMPETTYQHRPSTSQGRSQELGGQTVRSPGALEGRR